MKKWIYNIIMCSLLAACTDTVEVPTPKSEDGNTVSFDTYLSKVSTRAQTGTISNISSLRTAGFGVFGYSTGKSDYTSTLLPDFFYNQHVFWKSGQADDDENDALTGSTGSWTYSPLKMWPNDNGNKLSFFAYAPFQSIAMPQPETVTTPFSNNYLQTGEKKGIVAIGANSRSGDPLIGYQISNDSAQASVDLLYGVASNGLPNTNITHQQGDSVVRFRFKHALCRLGVNIRGDFPGMSVPVDPENGTIVLVKKITVTGNFPYAATLNLNNSTASEPLWQNPQYEDTVNSTSSIIIDDKSITRSLRDVDYKDIIANNDTALWNHNCLMGGVNATSRFLLKALQGEEETTGISDRAYFMFIPNGTFGTSVSTTQLTITVDYTVQTVDSSLVLTNGYSRQEITRTGNYEISSSLRPGHTYTLNITLSLHGMTFSATEEEWQ